MSKKKKRPKRKKHDSTIEEVRIGWKKKSERRNSSQKKERVRKVRIAKKLLLSILTMLLGVLLGTVQLAEEPLINFSIKGSISECQTEPDFKSLVSSSSTLIISGVMFSFLPFKSEASSKARGITPRASLCPN